MAHSPNDRADPKKALEDLAMEMNLDVGDVVRLYEASVAQLASRAKVDTYLHVFAMRELRDKLTMVRNSHRQTS